MRCYRAREAARSVWLQVSPPAVVGLEAGERFARSLAGVLHRTRRNPLRARHVACEFVATDAGVRLGVWVPPAIAAGAIINAVTGAWPGARIAQTTPPPVADGRGVCGRDVVPRGGVWSPLVDPSRSGSTQADVDMSDRLGQVVRVLADREPGEVAVAQVIVAAQRGTNTRRPALRILDGLQSALSELAVELMDGFGSLNRDRTKPRSTHATAEDPVQAELQRKIVAKKVSGPHLRVTVRVAICGPVPARYRRYAANRVAEGYDAVATTGNGMTTRPVHGAARKVAVRRPGAGFVATVRELAALWHVLTCCWCIGWTGSPTTWATW